MKKLSVVLFALVIASAAGAGDGTIHRPAGNEPVPDRYIVVFNAGLDAASTALELAATHGGNVDRVFDNGVPAAVFRMNEGQARGMAHNPKVTLVEQDSLFTVNAAGNQPNPPSWGLDRIDQRNLPLDDDYSYCFMGSGVNAYILDTGIRTTHVDFGGRASWGIDCTGEGQSDGHGHGTHVAGTTGGTSYGVAKDVDLVAVKVCNSFGSCPTSAILCGTDFVTQQKNQSPGTPMVANMSLGGGFSSTLNNAVASSVAAGVFYAVAAGNNNSNACNFSPASEPTAYTVGSTTISDARSSFSNFGTCVDIFAPGSSITSAWNTSNTATNTISGTSMASPHVAGAGALVLEQFPAFNPAQVSAELTARATAGVLSGVGSGSPNLLLFSKPAEQCPGTGTAYQVGSATIDENIRTVGLSGFNNPAVVMGPPSFAGNQPTTVRVRNVTSSSFDHNIQEWDYLDGTHVDETIGYLALEQGVTNLGSLAAEAGTVALNHNWQVVNFNQSFASAPVVIAQVGTFNGNQAVTTRIANVTASGFEIRLQEEEGNDGTHVIETVHWIAVATGTTTVGANTFVVGRTGNSVTHAWFTINFGQSLANPVVLADMQTFDGSDPAALRHRNLSTTSVQVKVEEEQSLDTEVNHTTEVVGYIAVSR